MLSFNELLERQYQNSPPSMVSLMDGADSIMNSAAASEASKSHKEAERRRRQRINSHLSTLRTLLPSTARVSCTTFLSNLMQHLFFHISIIWWQTDKASLLAEVVQHVKELKTRVDELARQDGGSSALPGELDEASLSFCEGGEAKLLKVTLCCEDRPGLNRDLIQAIRSVRVRVVKAEMVTVGGRTKSVVVMKWTGGGGGEEDVKVLKGALLAVVENRASGSRVGRLLGKRARFYGSVYDHHP